MYFIQIQYVMEKKKSATSMMENADDDRVFVFFVQNAIGPWPMHEVVPRAVRAAVRMLTMTCRMVFQVSLFFMVLDF
jgi:hypothetical protein